MRGVSAGAVPQTENELEATLEAEAKVLRGEGRGWFSGGGGSDASTAKRIDTLDKRMELLIRQQVTRQHACPPSRPTQLTYVDGLAVSAEFESNRFWACRRPSSTSFFI